MSLAANGVSGGTGSIKVRFTHPCPGPPGLLVARMHSGSVGSVVPERLRIFSNLKELGYWVLTDPTKRLPLIPQNVFRPFQIGKPKSSTRLERLLARLRRKFCSRIRLRIKLLCRPHDFPQFAIGSPQKQAVEISVAEISVGVCNEAVGF